MSKTGGDAGTSISSTKTHVPLCSAMPAVPPCLHALSGNATRDKLCHLSPLSVLSIDDRHVNARVAHGPHVREHARGSGFPRIANRQSDAHHTVSGVAGRRTSSIPQVKDSRPGTWKRDHLPGQRAKLILGHWE